MSENFSINGVSVAVEFSSLDYPLINSGISLNSEMIDFGVVTQATTRRIIVKNNALHDDALSLNSQNLGNFTIEKNSCPVSPLKLRSRKYCYLDIKYSAISNTSQQISSITIENKVVSLKVNQSVTPGIFWTKFMPSNLLDEGTQGGLRATALTSSWSNGAYGPAINGDFVLEYDITAVAIGGGVGDIMIGFHSIFPLIGVYPNHQIYADRGNSLSGYQGFQQPFSNSILVGDNWTITYQRIGVVITWTVVLPQGTFTGLVSSNLGGPIYPYIIAYSSGTRINSATLSQ
jgi:hypothetical protein